MNFYVNGRNVNRRNDSETVMDNFENLAQIYSMGGAKNLEKEFENIDLDIGETKEKIDRISISPELINEFNEEEINETINKSKETNKAIPIVAGIVICLIVTVINWMTRRLIDFRASGIALVAPFLICLVWQNAKSRVAYKDNVLKKAIEKLLPGARFYSLTDSNQFK